MFVWRCVLGLLFLGLFGCGSSSKNNEENSQVNASNSVAANLNFAATASNTKQLTFSWASVSGATHYNLLEDHDGLSGYSTIASNISSTQTAVSTAIHKRTGARYILEICSNSNCDDSAPLYLDSGSLNPAIGYIKASNSGINDEFAYAISISSDGNTLAVGAPVESSDAVGINGFENNNFAFASGAVYIFTRSGSSWAQEAYIKADNAEAEDYFGISVSLNADGNTLAVGAYAEDSDATGINGTNNNSEPGSGAAYVFTRSGLTWSQQAYIKASNTNENDAFGFAVSLDNSGDVLAIGAYQEDSDAAGINGTQSNNLASNSGAAYIFTRSASVWSQQAYIKASNSEENDWFAYALDLNGDGNTLAIGAYREDSNVTGIDNIQNNNLSGDSGAAYVFTFNGSTWSQQAYIKASNTNADDRFAYSLHLDDSGDNLVVGAYREDSNASSINGSEIDNTGSDSGAAYVFHRVASVWSQTAYLKASNSENSDAFGTSVAISGDGATIVVGAPQENSNSLGVANAQSNNSSSNSGAAYVFTYINSEWQQQAYLKASNSETDDAFASSISINQDGDHLTVGAISEASNADGVNGDQTDNAATNSGAVYLY